MHLYLGGTTAQAFWRLIYPRNRKLRIPLSSYLRYEECACNAADIAATVPKWIEACREHGYERIEAVVFEAAQKRISKTCTTTVWERELPAGSFCELHHDVSVSSPCFTFLQLSSILSLPELIAYGDELCGSYVFDASSPRGMVQRQSPLVTVDELTRYIGDADGLRGVKAARRALAHIVGDSASPMETLDEMLLCLPYLYGGYAVSQPAMNLPIELDEHAAAIAGKKSCRADLCWPEPGFIIEHQGDYDHNRNDSFSSDRARINGLKAHGYEVIELTGGIVGNLKSFEEIALHIAKLQRKRVPKYALGPTKSRLALRDALFGWNARYGRPEQPCTEDLREDW